MATPGLSGWARRWSARLGMWALLGAVLLGGASCDEGGNGNSDVQVLTPEVIRFDAEPEQITQGERSVLTWEVKDATALSLFSVVDQEETLLEIITDDAEIQSGNREVMPQVSTTYRLQAVFVASNGSSSQIAEDDAQVTVLDPPARPTVTLEVDPGAILRGGAATLSWTSTDAETLTLTANGGAVELPQGSVAQGSLEVTPEQDTEYELTANGPGGQATASASLAVREPVAVVSFTASPEAVPMGGVSTLSWEATGATRIEIRDGQGSVDVTGLDPLGDSVEVAVEQETTWTLTASNEDSQDSAQVTVTLLPAPIITTWSAELAQITRGGASILSWATEGAQSVQIFAGEEDITPVGAQAEAGSLEVSPTESTSYRLVATGPGGSVEQTLQLTVLDPVEIVSFAASPVEIVLGESVTLSWEVSGADTVTLSDDQGQEIDLEGQLLTGSVTLSPTEARDYILVATGPGGMDMATVTVSVDGMVRVALSLDPETIDEGGAATLSWQTIAADRIELVAEPGPSPDVSALEVGSDSLEVNPTQTTVYTLTAYGPEGSASQEVTLVVNPAVRIDSFQVQPSTVFRGESATVSWQTRHASTVRLRVGEVEEEVEASGERVFADMQEETTFTLIAEGVGGPLEQSAVVDVTEVPIPVIVAFTADPGSLERGQSAQLAWETQRVDSLSLVALIEGQDGNTPVDIAQLPVGQGGVSVSPRVTTTYRLTAVNEHGQITRDVTVAVPLEIESLTASAEAIRPGEQVEISWQLQGALRAELVLGQQTMDAPLDAEGAGSLTLPLVPPAQVTLRAFGPGEAQAVASVSVTGLAPEIQSFTSSVEGPLGAEQDSATLSWAVTADTEELVLQVLLQGQEEAVEITLGPEQRPMGSLEVSPSLSATYTLVARNGFGQDSQAVDVSVELAIDSLRILPSQTITYGVQPTLLWEVRGAARAELALGEDPAFPAMLDEQGMGSFVLPGVAPLEVTLTAYDGADGSVSQSASLQIAPPEITALTASPDFLGAGMSRSTLSGTAVGVQSLRLLRGQVEVLVVDCSQTPTSCSFSHEVTPGVSSTWTLEATNPAGQVTQDVSVTVPVAVLSFAASPTEVLFGGSSQLSWTLSGASQAMLQLGEGEPFPVDLGPEGQGSYTLSNIQAPLVATLIASHDGEEARSQVSIDVAAPTIDDFSASSAQVDLEERFTLFWQTSGAQTLTLEGTTQDGQTTQVDISNESPQMGSVELTTTNSVQYTLTATNPAGMVESTVIVIVPLRILELGVEPSPTVYGQSATVSWRIQGAAAGTVSYNEQTLPIELTPDGRGSFAIDSVQVPGSLMLRIEDLLQQSVSDSVDLSFGAPTVSSFTATPQAVSSGDQVTLSWQVQGAAEVSLLSVDSRGTELRTDFLDFVPQEHSITVNTVYSTDFTLLVTNPAGQTTASASVLVTNEPRPAQILSFEASPNQILPEQSSQVTWMTLDAVTLTLQTYNTDGELLGEEIIPVEEHAGSSRLLTPFESLRLRLVAVGEDGQEVTAEASIDVRGDVRNLQLSEVYYDAVGTDDGAEWIEIYNPGPGLVDLSEAVLGHGGGSFYNTMVQLPSLDIPQGGCVVVGGPLSNENNLNPEIDAAFNFDPDIQNSGARADGVALFAGTVEELMQQEVPLPFDAVTYGGEIAVDDFFVTPFGDLYEVPDVGDASATQSITRSFTPQLLLPQGEGLPLPTASWFINDAPTPGRCFGLNPQEVGLPFDSQVFVGRRQGPEAGGNDIGLAGFHLNENTQVLFGDSPAECIFEEPGALCTVPPGQGRVDLTLRSEDGDVVYPGFYAYEGIDFCNIQFPTEIFDAPGAQVTIYGRVYHEGTTEAQGDSGALEVQWGYGPEGVDPAFSEETWAFFDASFNVQVGNDDEYQYTATLPEFGFYLYAFRVREAGGEIWTYCDTNGTVNNDPEGGNFFSLDDAGTLFTLLQQF